MAAQKVCRGGSRCWLVRSHRGTPLHSNNPSTHSCRRSANGACTAHSHSRNPARGGRERACGCAGFCRPSLSTPHAFVRRRPGMWAGFVSRLQYAEGPTQRRGVCMAVVTCSRHMASELDIVNHFYCVFGPPSILLPTVKRVPWILAKS